MIRIVVYLSLLVFSFGKQYNDLRRAAFGGAALSPSPQQRRPPDSHFLSLRASTRQFCGRDGIGKMRSELFPAGMATVLKLRGGADDGSVETLVKDLQQHHDIPTDASRIGASALGMTMSRVGRIIAPALLSFLGVQAGSSDSGSRLMNLGSIYAWSLIGSSVGFYLFLYFISVGYAVGIFLPTTVTLIACLRYRSPSVSTLIHASLVILWSLRLALFLLWREYRNWPALHTKIVQVNEQKRFSAQQKILCWIAYSFLYVCLLTPCWFRLEDANTAGVSSGTRLGIGLQVVGLLVESIADYQKSTFKARNRLDWCQSGLWRYSTHPNYAGEWLFWLGSWIAGGTPRNWPEVIMSLVGLGFITLVLNGASNALEEKQRAKYGAEYARFRERTTIFGPKFWAREKFVVEVNSTSVVLECNETEPASTGVP